MGFIHHVNVPDLCMFKCSMWILLVIYCYQNTECGPSFKPSVHRNYMPWVSSSSLSRSKPGVNIQCSNQIYQAILTRVARQPANSHRHLTAFVFRNREGREGEHTQEGGSLCKVLAYPKQPSSTGGGVHLRLYCHLLWWKETYTRLCMFRAGFHSEFCSELWPLVRDVSKNPSVVCYNCLAAAVGRGRAAAPLWPVTHVLLKLAVGKRSFFTPACSTKKCNDLDRKDCSYPDRNLEMRKGNWWIQNRHKFSWNSWYSVITWERDFSSLLWIKESENSFWLLHSSWQVSEPVD